MPKIVVNESVQFEGALPEPMFLQQVLRAVDAPPSGDAPGEGSG